MKKEKKKMRGRIVACVMAVFTLLPVGFSVIQGVATYQATQYQPESAVTSEDDTPQIKPGTSIMDQSADNSTDNESIQ